MRRLRALVVIGALVLAGQAAARSAGPATTYKVKRGDTLSRIARRHHTTVEALTAANALA
ncbi:MAG: LysM domain, partial [Acidimicrobiaceae bacterium]|nr:LysM domain [Acidimicrobiaceae bacterium]